MARRSARRQPASFLRHWPAAAAMAAGVVLSFVLLPLPQATFAALLAMLAVFIAAVDIEHMIIPDIGNVAMFVLGLALVVAEALPGTLPWDIGDALLRSAVAGGALAALRYVYSWRTGVEGLGLGDVKLAAAGAPFLAWPVLPVALLIAAFGGLLAVGARALAQGQRPARQVEVPFGAFLAPAIWLAYVIGQAGLPV